MIRKEKKVLAEEMNEALAKSKLESSPFRIIGHRTQKTVQKYTQGDSRWINIFSLSSQKTKKKKKKKPQNPEKSAEKVEVIEKQALVIAEINLNSNISHTEEINKPVEQKSPEDPLNGKEVHEDENEVENLTNKLFSHIKAAKV